MIHAHPSGCLSLRRRRTRFTTYSSCSALVEIDFQARLSPFIMPILRIVCRAFSPSTNGIRYTEDEFLPRLLPLKLALSFHLNRSIQCEKNIPAYFANKALLLDLCRRCDFRRLLHVSSFYSTPSVFLRQVGHKFCVLASFSPCSLIFFIVLYLYRRGMVDFHFSMVSDGGFFF